MYQYQFLIPSLATSLVYEKKNHTSKLNQKERRKKGQTVMTSKSRGKNTLEAILSYFLS